MKWSPAEEAIREFPFWDYGMDEVDPKSEYAEWVPELAAVVEEAVRKQVSRELRSHTSKVFEEVAKENESGGRT